MSINRQIWFLVLLFLFSAVVSHFAQAADEAAKLKRERHDALIEQILADAPNLKLEDNRAVVYAKIGNLLWKTDEQRARRLFQNAVIELRNAQTQAETEVEGAGNRGELLRGQTIRPQILNIIAARDAELALEYLYFTRPSMVTKAIADQQFINSKINDHAEEPGYLARNEFDTEQGFIRRAAEQNPQRAVKLLKESLEKGFSAETLNLLNKLNEKNPRIAAETASEIVGKLIESEFITGNRLNYQNINVAFAFLKDYIAEQKNGANKQMFDDRQMRGLADKLISFHLSFRGGNLGNMKHGIFQIAEKLSPKFAAQMKNQIKSNQTEQIIVSDSPKPNISISAETATEQLFAATKDFSPQLRAEIYQTAADKLLEQGETNRAEEVLNNIFYGRTLEQKIYSLKQQHLYNLSAAEKFAEVEAFADRLPPAERNFALVNLAKAVYQKNPADNKRYAAAILEKARSRVSAKPANVNEMSQLMQIISAYLEIEPVTAFALYEPLIAQFNELNDAAAVIGQFQGGSNILKGEFLLNDSCSTTYGTDYSFIQMMADKSFELTLNLINEFNKPESRLCLRLQLAEKLSQQ